jgi:hypothetical protein
MALYTSISDSILTSAQISRPGLCTAPASAKIPRTGLRTAPAATKIPRACLRAAALTGPILTTSIQTAIRARRTAEPLRCILARVGDGFAV